MRLKTLDETYVRLCSEAHRARFAARKPEEYKVNVTQFQKVETPEAAYILGLLWADGYIIENADRGEIRLSMVADDCQHITPTFVKTGTWVIKTRKTKWRPMMFVQTHHRPFAEYLKSLDYIAKSRVSADKVLGTIPEHLKHYWFRGLFDGDGGLYLNPDGKHCKLNIASSYDQDWGYIESMFKTHGNDHYRVQRRIAAKTGFKGSCFEITKRSTILRFCEYLYQGWEQDQIGLPRKHDKYLTLLEWDKRLTANRNGKGNMVEETATPFVR
jgi:hypothetical protein